MKSLLLALGLGVCAAAPAPAPPTPPAQPAQAVKPRIFPGILVELKTKDGWALKAKFNPPKQGMPSVLLLHGTGGRKEDWYWLGRPLFKRGFGYLAVDLRGHGESRTGPDGKPAAWRKFIVNKDHNGVKKYNEYLNMMADVEAGVEHLAAQGVAEDRITIIGADVGSCLALRYAALHSQIPMVALLSPRMQYQDVTTVNALRAYKGRPIMMMYSEADKNTASGMSILQSFARMSVGEQLLTVITAPTEHGTKMLRGPVLGQVFDWMQNPVKPEVVLSTEAASGGVSGSTETYEEDGPDGAAAEPSPSGGDRGVAPYSARIYARLPTERPNPRTRHIDRRSPFGIARAINREDALVAQAVSRQSRAIARGMELLAACLRGGGSVTFLGAGTSGRLAVLEAAECPPTYGTTSREIRAVMAGGRSSVFRSKEGAEDDPRAGARAVRALGPGDAVVGIAASGVTPFVAAALRAARGQGCRTILVTSNGHPPDNPAELTIAPDVGPEVVAGSTRMKSGTAAKLVLNTLTTGTMILLGKVYDRWMVDLKPTSRKLKLRGERIIADLCRVSPARARALFKTSGWSVKTAVVMARRGLRSPEARLLLAHHGGALRKALEAV